MPVGRLPQKAALGELLAVVAAAVALIAGALVRLGDGPCPHVGGGVVARHEGLGQVFARNGDGSFASIGEESGETNAVVDVQHPHVLALDVHFDVEVVDEIALGVQVEDSLGRLGCRVVRDVPHHCHGAVHGHALVVRHVFSRCFTRD